MENWLGSHGHRFDRTESDPSWNLIAPCYARGAAKSRAKGQGAAAHSKADGHGVKAKDGGCEKPALARKQF